MLSNCKKAEFVCPYKNNDEKSFLRLVDLDGNSLGEINVGSLPSSDDFEMLSDGLWITYGNDGNINYNYLTPPGQ